MQGAKEEGWAVVTSTETCPFSSDRGNLRRDSRKGKVGHLVQTGGLTLGLQISLLDLKVTEGSQHLGGQSRQART